MLGQIANYATVISRNTITKLSTSLNDIWAKLRQHYGFLATGAQFLDLSNIHLQPDEIHADIFQRLLAFFEDNLLVTGCGITHHGSPITTNEDLTPYLENTVILLWLQMIHLGLPQLTKQTTLQIPRIYQTRDFTSTHITPPTPIILAALHSYVKTTDVHATTEQEAFSDEQIHKKPGEKNDLLDNLYIRHVSVIPSPFLNMYYGHHHVRLTLDNSTTTNMKQADFAIKIGLLLTPAPQLATS